MNFFDKVIIEFVLKYFNRSYHFFHLIRFISENNLLKGGVFAILIWYVWFKVGPAAIEKRIQLLATLISVFFVMAVTLSLAGLAPFRNRPFLNPDFDFTTLVPVNETLSKMSSFPSDHAALFICLATGLLFVSRKVGLMAIIYTIFVIFFPRLYLGYHYPSDLLIGSLIGASITVFFIRSAAVRKMISRWIIPFTNNYPGYFYAILFLVTYQIADLFWGTREIFTFLYKLCKHKV